MSERNGTKQRKVIVRSDKDTHFTGSLDQNAGEDESITIEAIHRTNEFIIEHIAVLSDQNLEWDVFLWAKNTYADSDHDVDEFIEYVNFTSNSGKQIAAADIFYYSATGLSIPYRDDDVGSVNNASLHLSLVNRSASSKNSGATGEIVIIVSMRPVYGN